jgi:predicted SAM-dependent methyltransferase
LKGLLRQLLVKHASEGVREAVARLRGELLVARRHRAGVRRAAKYRGAQGLRLNLACGTNVKPGWVNADLFDPHADLALDLREPLPFDDRCAAIVYAEHFFEHLEYPAATSAFLKESLRVLRPGGQFSVVVPDTEWPLRAYVLGEEEYFRIARELWQPETCNTRMHQVNFHFRQYQEHKYAYDFETLALVLREAGLTGVVRREFDPGLDSELRRIGSLYVDAHKPAV